MKLSQTLSSYRQKNNYTQQQLANKLHISRKTISNWENGRSEPNFEFLKELSQLYNVSTDQLLAVSTTKSKTSKSKVTFVSAWKNFGKNLFSLKGRVSREEYNYVMIPLVILPFILLLLGVSLAIISMAHDNLTLVFISDIIEFIPSIFFAILEFCLVARRSHDVGLVLGQLLYPLYPIWVHYTC